MKYEILRAEVNYGVRIKKSQVLWDKKFQAPEISKLAAMASILCEVVNLGSTRIALERYDNGLPQGHEPNDWCLQPEYVYLSGYLIEQDFNQL